LKLKQFASQFKNVLPNLSFSDIKYKNVTNYQTESSNDTESEDDEQKNMIVITTEIVFIVLL